METEFKPLKLKSPIQQLLEWLETPAVWGEHNMSVKAKVKSLLEEEQRQITWAFDNGKCRAYGVADGECEAKFGFQFYNETYTENEHK